MLLADTLK